MPVQRTKSVLMAKLGNRLSAFHEEHKDDPVEMSNFGELPPGIENGIAQLVECKIDTFKKGDLAGELFFYAAGIVRLPTDHDGLPIKGLRTSIMEALCDTPTRTRASVEDHLAWVYNELKKLGVDTGSMGVDDLEATLEALRTSAPHFRFRTWKGEATPAFPNPRTNHNWNGTVDYTGESGAGVTDNSSEAAKIVNRLAPPASLPSPPRSNGKSPTSALGKHMTAGPTPKPTKPAAPVAAPVSAGFTEFSLDELAVAAAADDSDAQAELTRLAEEAGMTPDDITGAASWDEVVAYIQAGTEEAAPAGSSSSGGDPENPQVEEVYNYRPVDPKTKKQGKPVECQVMAVDKKTKTVTLADLANNKRQFKAIRWSSLEPVT